MIFFTFQLSFFKIYFDCEAEIDPQVERINFKKSL